MGEDRVDPAALEAELLDAGEVADLIGLANRTSVHTYLHRPHLEFPAPRIRKNSGKCVLWLRADIEAWLRTHPGRRR